MHPRDRLARRHISVKLGLLITLISSCKTRDSDGTPPPDRGVPPHRGEGHINHQVVALTVEVQSHKIPYWSCVIPRAHPSELLDLDVVAREACLLDHGNKLQNYKPWWMRCLKMPNKGASDRVSFKAGIRVIRGERACTARVGADGELPGPKGSRIPRDPPQRDSGNGGRALRRHHGVCRRRGNKSSRCHVHIR